jgi:hypothetical protein
MALNTSDIPAECTYVAYGCTSGKAPIGAVLDPATNEVAFVMYACPDCMAEQAYSDWYKSENGMRPRWMTREEKIDAYWQLPGVGVRD